VLADVETKGLTLEDIDLMFEGTKTLFLGPTSERRGNEIAASRQKQTEEAMDPATGKSTPLNKVTAEIEHVETKSEA
jgi:hypothetical protein